MEWIRRFNAAVDRFIRGEIGEFIENLVVVMVIVLGVLTAIVIAVVGATLIAA